MTIEILRISFLFYAAASPLKYVIRVHIYRSFWSGMVGEDSTDMQDTQEASTNAKTNFFLYKFNPFSDVWALKKKETTTRTTPMMTT